MPIIHHFLIVYDRLHGVVLSRSQFEDADEAAGAYAALELRHRNDDNLEIVLIGSDSIETVMQTHSNYFGDIELAGYLESVA